MRSLGALAAAVLATSASVAALPASNTTCNGHCLVRKSIDALGGLDALRGLKGVSYESEKLFRARTVSQNYHLESNDRYVVVGGSQVVSFSIRENNEYFYRLDRTYIPDIYFTFRRHEILPRNVSLVQRSGSDGYACAREGSYCVLLEANQTYGYYDAAMTDYLLFESSKLSPALLLKVLESNPIATTVDFWNTTLPAVHVASLGNITIGFNPETHLPFVIRSFQHHPVRGTIVNDLHLFDYKEVDGLNFPHQRRTFSNETRIIDETIVTHVIVNPTFDAEWFDGNAGDIGAVASAPKPDPSYPHAILAEYFTDTIWIAKTNVTTEELQVTVPAPDDLPGAMRLQFPNNANYVQMALEFEDSVIIFESPHKQTDHVIEWVNTTLKKPISHLWVSHHHHDHNLDVATYVALGAKIIVPEIARSYWSQIQGIDLVTITEDKPYIHSDSKMQARFLWRADNPHASDWTYAVITTACPTANSSTIAYTADIWGSEVFFDSRSAMPWLRQAIDDGLSKNTIIVPTHGVVSPFRRAYEPLGIVYPEHNSTSFKTGGNICLK